MLLTWRPLRQKVCSLDGQPNVKGNVLVRKRCFTARSISREAVTKLAYGLQRLFCRMVKEVNLLITVLCFKRLFEPRESAREKPDQSRGETRSKQSSLMLEDVTLRVNNANNACRSPGQTWTGPKFGSCPPRNKPKFNPKPASQKLLIEDQQNLAMFLFSSITGLRIAAPWYYLFSGQSTWLQGVKVKMLIH